MDQVGELLGEVRPDGQDRIGLGGEELEEQVVGGLGLVRRAPGEQLVEDGGDRVEVAAGGRLAGVPGLLGGHVQRSTQARVGLGELLRLLARLLGDLADTEVEELDEIRLAIPLDHEGVGGLEIAVDDALAVGDMEAPQDLEHEVDRPGDGEPRRGLALDKLGEIAPLEHLHDEVGEPRREDAHIVDAHDMIGLDPPGGDALVHEALDGARHAEHIGADELERHVGFQDHMVRRHHGPHAPLPENTLDAVLAVDDFAGRRVRGRARNAHCSLVT